MLEILVLTFWESEGVHDMGDIISCSYDAQYNKCKGVSEGEGTQWNAVIQSGVHYLKVF